MTSSDLPLFPDGEIPTVTPAPKRKRPESAVWTTRKALLIKLYLELFVYVTNRGTYLDAFAGPQDNGDAWAAKMLWENDPGKKRRRLDRYELVELSPSSHEALEAMVKATEENGRKCSVYRGDSNKVIPEILLKNPITNPAFCLLDQRTTECSWDLVRTVATHKSEGHKVELFYFLMAGWKNRTFKALKKAPEEDIRRWWGRDDIHLPKSADQFEISTLFCERFQTELGYRHVVPYPIYNSPLEHENSGRLQYYMIHCSDHDAAPDFMYRAYNKLARGYNPNAFQDAFTWTRDELAGSLSKWAGDVKV